MVALRSPRVCGFRATPWLARLSINGIVVSNCGANYPTLSNIHARMHTTVEGQQTVGTEGLIGFQKDMYRAAGRLKLKRDRGSTAGAPSAGVAAGIRTVLGPRPRA